MVLHLSNDLKRPGEGSSNVLADWFNATGETRRAKQSMGLGIPVPQIHSYFARPSVRGALSGFQFAAAIARSASAGNVLGMRIRSSILR